MEHVKGGRIRTSNSRRVRAFEGARSTLGTSRRQVSAVRTCSQNNLQMYHTVNRSRNLSNRKYLTYGNGFPNVYYFVGCILSWLGALVVELSLVCTGPAADG